MTDNEKKYYKKVNMDKAHSMTTASIILSVVGLITYIIPLIKGNFDFGIVFEAITLFFIGLARFSISNYDWKPSKRFTILAIIPIGWLLIYDFISIFSNISNGMDIIELGYIFFKQEGAMLLNVVFLSVIVGYLNTADNPEKYEDNTSKDWFYEKLDEDELKKINNIDTENNNYSNNNNNNNNDNDYSNF